MPSSARRFGVRMWRLVRRDWAATLGFLVFLAILLTALLGTLFVDFHPRATDLSMSFHPPGAGSPLGRDHLGRDVLERLIIGARYSLLNGLQALLIAAGIGVPLGLIAGYFRGLIDEVVMSLIEVLMTLPGILLALLVIAVLGPGQRNVVFAVGISAVPVFMRMTRGSTLGIREMEFVSASRVLGGRSVHVLRKHVFPGIVSEIVVTAVLSFGTMIISIAGLGFLGFGGEASIPEWGAMLKEGLPYMRDAPWLMLAPAAAIVVTVLSFNLMGDGLADAIQRRSGS